jgi:hypothetical protein
MYLPPFAWQLTNDSVQDSNQKKNANTANQQGFYKEVVCVPCLLSLGEMTFDDKKTWGAMTKESLIALR